MFANFLECLLTGLGLTACGLLAVIAAPVILVFNMFSYVFDSFNKLRK